jgi:hypothetical protein
LISTGRRVQIGTPPALLEGEAEGLTRKAVEMALGGDTTALRLCLERLVPPRKDKAIAITLPKLVGPVFSVMRRDGPTGRASSAPPERTAPLVAGVAFQSRRRMMHSEWRPSDYGRVTRPPSATYT